MSPEMTELGLVGLALIVIWKIAEIGKALLLAKKINGFHSTDGKLPTMTPLACQVDPVHFQTILDTRKDTVAIKQYTDTNKETMRSIRSGVGSGAFSCAWKDRDEVRDFIECMGNLIKAMDRLTKEVERSNNGG